METSGLESFKPDENGSKVEQICNEHATTSKGGTGTVNPENDSHNMNDLKALDFNSADDVRQAMRGIISGNISQSTNEEVDCQTFNTDKQSMLTPIIQIIQIPNNIRPTSPRVVEKDDDSRLDLQSVKVSKKRPGRPAKAGPSKKVRKSSVADLYLGKLSNVVPFKHNRPRARRHH